MDRINLALLLIKITDIILDIAIFSIENGDAL